MPLDLGPPVHLLVPPKPAIVRSVGDLLPPPALAFLPGFFTPGAAAAKPKVATLTQPAGVTATSTAQTITGPAGILAGDLLVLWDFAVAAITPTSVIPSGFTSLIDFADGFGLKGILSAKIATGAEASASLTGMNAGLRNTKQLYVFRGNLLISSFSALDIASEATDNDPVAQVVNASGGIVPLLVLGCYGMGQNVAINPRTFTPAKDGEISGGQTAFLAYKIYNSSPADVTVDKNDEGLGNALASCYIQCA